MRRLVSDWVGGPIGRLRFDLLSMPACGGGLPTGIRRIEAGELDEPDVAELLAPDLDHALRIRDGDSCYVAESPDASIIGLVWLNLISHTDMYAGSWSQPTSRSAYLNQLIVGHQHRGAGVGRALIRAARVDANQIGRAEVHCVISPKNTASRRAFISEGAAVRHRLFGVRIGSRSLSLRRPPSATDS